MRRVEWQARIIMVPIRENPLQQEINPGKSSTRQSSRSRATALRACCSLLLLVTAAACTPETPDPEPPPAAFSPHFPSDADLLTLIRTRVDEERAVGIVLGVLEADGTTRVVNYGDAGAGAEPLNDKSMFEIGSITKVFTGILLAEMVARGEVAYADPVAKFLPDEVSIPTRDGRAITLLDLSTHHSALPRLPGNMAPADEANPYADYSVEQMYEFLSSVELQRDIGAEYEYSNLAVGLLGHVLAGVGGGTYAEVVTERILQPLGMNSTGVALSADMQRRMAKGHDMQGEVVPLWDLPTLAGAGALRSDAADMLVFLQANTGPASSALEEAMRESHYARESVGEQLDIGLNWHIRKIGAEKIVWHNGGTAGFRTFIGFDPDKNVGVVVLTNSAHGADDIGFHLVNDQIPLAEPPVEREEVEVSTAVLETYVGDYELVPEFVIAITLEDGSLYLQATDQPRFPLFAESEDKYFLKVVDAQISFVKGESGMVEQLILHQNGVDQPARKL